MPTRLSMLKPLAPFAVAAVFAAPAQADDEVRAIVAEMLADAETRTSLLADGNAGHDGSKFFLAGDGYKLTIGGHMQFRYTANFRDDSPTGDDFSSGFTNRRLKLDINSVLPGGWETYFTARLRSGGELEAEIAAVAKKWGDGWQFRGGQFRFHIVREETMADRRMVALERSIPTFAYAQGYPQGVELSKTNESTRWFVAFGDGLKSDNTDLLDKEDTSKFVVSKEAEYAFSGRFDAVVGQDADFKRFDEMNPRRGKGTGALVGGAVHWQQSPNTAAPTDRDRDTLLYTADALVHGDGWTIFGAFIGRYTETRSSSADSDFNDFGATVLAAWNVAEKWDLYARWEALYVDSARGQLGTNFNFLTFGASHSFAGHAAKVTGDVLWALDDTTGLRTLGLLPSSGIGLSGQGEENEVAIRVQFQMLF
jgi:hypothetical protein